MALRKRWRPLLPFFSCLGSSLYAQVSHFNGGVLMRRLIVIFGVALGLMLGGFSQTVLAQPQVGQFHIKFDSIMSNPSGDPSVDDGWENPATGERWFYYGNAPGNPFWNQWWYDDPPTWDRWKEITYDITIESWPLDPQSPPPEADRVIVALNWSNMEYPETGQPGPPPNADQEWAIERKLIFDGPVSSGDVVQFSSDVPFIIPDYNPEWVSIDVWVEYMNPEPVNRIEIFGGIKHECIPEPSTLCLLAAGALGLLVSGRRNRS
jgi:PEP-CTERM motif-containing protein